MFKISTDLLESPIKMSSHIQGTYPVNPLFPNVYTSSIDQTSPPLIDNMYSSSQAKPPEYQSANQYECQLFFTELLCIKTYFDFQYSYDTMESLLLHQVNINQFQTMLWQPTCKNVMNILNFYGSI